VQREDVAPALASAPIRRAILDASLTILLPLAGGLALLQAYAWAVHLILVNKPDASGFKRALDLMQS
jgi:hypothetical protein